MDVQKKYKWALTGLIIMILLNAATLVTIWMNQPYGKDRKANRDLRHDRASIQEYLKDELGLTEEQAQTITEMRRGHYREIRAYRDSLDKNRRAYFEFVMSENAENEEKRDSLLNVLTDHYEDIEGLLYSHMTEVKEVLNDEQEARFEEMMLNTFFRDNSDRRERQRRDNR